MDGRAGAGYARSHRRRRARLPRPARADHLAPQLGVLENRPLDPPPPRRRVFRRSRRSRPLRLPPFSHPWEFSIMMVLYSGTTDPYSHRCRFVLFEKGMDFEIRDVDLFAKPEDIALMNPYNEVPILVERDLILYESHIINEYIDERFPHPQLMPGDPVARARVRLFLFNFEKELFSNVNILEGRGGVKPNDKQLEKARAQIRDRLTQLAPIFLKNKYMLGDDFSMLDVAIAPLLWRIDYYGIELSKNAAPLLKYAERIFSRPAYIEALTPSEKVMRK